MCLSVCVSVCACACVCVWIRRDIIREALSLLELLSVCVEADIFSYAHKQMQTHTHTNTHKLSMELASHVGQNHVPCLKQIENQW